MEGGGKGATRRGKEPGRSEEENVRVGEEDLDVDVTGQSGGKKAGVGWGWGWQETVEIPGKREGGAGNEGVTGEQREGWKRARKEERPEP